MILGVLGVLLISAEIYLWTKAYLVSAIGGYMLVHGVIGLL